MSRETAEALAIAALAFLAADPERLGRFLALSGLGPEQIRAAARQAGFLAGVLEHVTADESLLLTFAGNHQLDPADVPRALAALGGVRWEREAP